MHPLYLELHIQKERQVGVVALDLVNQVSLPLFRAWSGSSPRSAALRTTYDPVHLIQHSRWYLYLSEHGGDEQNLLEVTGELHESIRTHAHGAARRIKEEGATNDLLERLAADPAFASVKDEIPGMLDPHRFVGRSPEQVDAFIRDHVEPALDRNRDALAADRGEVRV